MRRAFPAIETLAKLAARFQGSDAQIAGAGADDGDGAHAGRGHELCRRVPDADRGVPGPRGLRRADEAAAGAGRRGRRALNLLAGFDAAG